MWLVSQFEGQGEDVAAEEEKKRAVGDRTPKDRWPSWIHRSAL